MRVIAGSARRLQLKSPEGNNVRPTSDRIKETLFNIIQNDVIGCRFLDLFAGSAGIGIEALSRGASTATFVDNSRESIKIIEYNIRHTKFQEKSTILHMDALMAIRRLESWNKKFDIVFIDPPYNENLYLSVLNAIKDSKLLSDNAIIILETLLEEDDSRFIISGYELIKIKNYKSNKHIFLRKEIE